MKYFLFRHGSTRASTTDNVYHGEEIVTADILENAKPIVHKIGEYLKKEQVENFYTSPFKRCLQTMEIVKSVTGKDYTIDDRLGEFREDQGEPFENFGQRIRDFISQVENGKPARNATQRVAGGWKMANPSASLRTGIAICTHGAGLSAFKSWLLRGSYQYSDLMDFPQSGVLWIIDDKKLEEIDFNQQK